MSKNTLPARSELPEDKTWDLTLIYPTSEAWEADFAKLDAKIAAAAAFAGKLGEGARTLAAAYESLDDLGRLAEKLYVYAHLKSDEDTADSRNASREKRIEAKFAELSAATAYFDPEVMALPEETVQACLSAPEMAFYQRSFQQLLESREHVLSSAEERLLGALSDLLRTPDATYSALADADMRFPKVADARGRRIELSHGNYIKFLESADRRVRRNAFKAMFTTYRNLRNTCAATLDGTVKRHAVSAKLRKFNSSLSAALFDDRVPESVYTSLISAVHANLAPLHRYIQLRGKVLGVKRMNMYDLHCPLRPASTLEYTWEETAATVKAALAPLGKEYGELLERAFSERWVDILECRGKRSGAYSSGCFDTPPYLLLNFHGRLNDVFTLAHELGHSMHSFHSNASQKYHYADYSIFVAEVASTTNEILLQHHLMERAADEDVKINLLSHLIDEIRGTVYRQTMFAEFELKMHQLREGGSPLTADLLEEEYYKLNARYHGEKVKADKLIGMEWARIPHFYYNFYVYKYATGMSAAMVLAKNILSGDPGKLADYFGFLRAGSSKDVLDIMRDAGVDLSAPAPVEACLREFAAAVDELEKLLLPRKTRKNP